MLLVIRGGCTAGGGTGFATVKRNSIVAERVVGNQNGTAVKVIIGGGGGSGVVVVAVFAIRARTDRCNARFRIAAVSRRPFRCKVRRRSSCRAFGVVPTSVAIRRR